MEIETPGTAVVWVGAEVITAVRVVPGVLVGTEVAVAVVGVTGGEVGDVTGAVGTVVAGVVPDGVLVHPAVTMTRTRIATLGKMYRFRLELIICHLQGEGPLEEYKSCLSSEK